MNTDRSTPRRTTLILSLFTLAAMGLAWGLGETPLARTTPEKSRLVVMGQQMQTEAVTAEAQSRAELFDASKIGALAGLALAVALGFAGSMLVSRAMDWRQLLAAAGGAVLGGLAPFAARIIYEAVRRPGMQDLMPHIVQHLIQWGPLGMAAGLGLGLGRGERGGRLGSTVLTGLVGAAIGSFAYDVIGSIAFSLDGPERMVPGSLPARLIAFACIGIGIALLLATPLRASRSTHAAFAVALLALASPLLTASSADARATVRQDDHRFEFEVVESFDAKYLGDTPGHLGRNGGLGDRPPFVALGDPVFRGEVKIGSITHLDWDHGRGSLTVEFDPEPRVAVFVGEKVWVRLGDL